MATTLNCFSSVRATAAPLSQEPPPPPRRTPRETKVILPDKKPLKWSTGVAPGDYGGPPTSTKLRKYWGGEEEDPLTSDDFIWNKDFMPRMMKLIQEPSAPTIPLKEQEQEASGFLSINRVMSLDSLEVDLSKELTASLKPVMEREPTVASNARTTNRISRKWKLVPTRKEQEKWDKAAKGPSGGTDMMLREVRQPQGDPRVLAAESRKKYYELKKKLQIYTLGVGGIGLVSSYISYSPEVAASFGAGFLGSLVYIRMLGSSVDSMADGARGLMKGAIAQPRLLVPVALVMIFNRWNQIVVPQFGAVHLELIPILLGFFTYKMATFIQAIEEAVSVVESKS